MLVHSYGSDTINLPKINRTYNMFEHPKVTGTNQDNQGSNTGPEAWFQLEIFSNNSAITF